MLVEYMFKLRNLIKTPEEKKKLKFSKTQQHTQVINIILMLNILLWNCKMQFYVLAKIIKNSLNQLLFQLILWEGSFKRTRQRVFTLPALFFYLELSSTSFSHSCSFNHSSYSALPSSLSKKAIMSGRKHLAIDSNSCLGILVCLFTASVPSFHLVILRKPW